MTRRPQRDPSALESGSPDGRVRRGARNRERIVDALLDWVREGHLQPTAEQVARRAGVGERTVFRHFEDMESLFAEMSRRLRASIQPILDEPQPEGDTAIRLRGLVARRVRIYEEIAPFRRSADVSRFRSAYLQRDRVSMNRALRREVESVFAPELARGPDELADVLDLLLSFEAWERLRSDQRLGRERAQRVVESSLLAVLGGRT